MNSPFRLCLLLLPIVFVGCAGVPSVSVGFTHTNPALSHSGQGNSRWTWTFGSNLEATFHDTGVVLEPCATAMATIHDVTYRDIYAGGDVQRISQTAGTGWTIPVEACYEFDTGHYHRHDDVRHRHDDAERGALPVSPGG